MTYNHTCDIIAVAGVGGIMNFNSFEFLLFFPIVTLFYFLLPKKIKWAWLLVTSYFFYMCWNPLYVLLMLFSTVVTYLSGLLISKSSRSDVKKIAVFFAFFLNLSILFFYKYFDFVIDNLNHALTVFRIELVVPTFDLLLPVGISFYTFQALSYTMDVYRNKVEAERNPFKYALFVSFFPQLVAGPIERSKNLLNQLKVPHSFDYERVKNGLLLMLYGLFQKMVVADRIAVFVDAVYNEYTGKEGELFLVASILFAVQIYCDFAGYSDVARGAARVLGIELMKNFNNPYSAVSVKDFWSRWHISLSSWFRDYLYIPLGGNRCSAIRKYFNVMTVFVISGLWHGARWGFVFWGLLHGFYQIVGEITQPLRKKLCVKIKLNTSSFSYRLMKQISVFILVDIAWIFFRTQSITGGVRVINTIISDMNLSSFFHGTVYELGVSQTDLTIMMICVVAFVVLDNLRSRINIAEFINRQQLWFRWSCYLALILLIVYLGAYGSGYSGAQFIYFQF